MHVHEDQVIFDADALLQVLEGVRVSLPYSRKAKAGWALPPAKPSKYLEVSPQNCCQLPQHLSMHGPMQTSCKAYIALGAGKLIVVQLAPDVPNANLNAGVDHVCILSLFVTISSEKTIYLCYCCWCFSLARSGIGILVNML